MTFVREYPYVAVQITLSIYSSAISMHAHTREVHCTEQLSNQHAHTREVHCREQRTQGDVFVDVGAPVNLERFQLGYACWTDVDTCQHAQSKFSQLTVQEYNRQHPRA